MTVQTKANIAAGAFLAACLLPAAGMLLPERPAAANQALAPPPSFTRPDGSWNPALLQEVSDYIADHFGFRQELITAEAALEASMFHSSASDKVLLGREGWLFYQETLPGYLHTDPMTERELYAAAHTLALVQEYAAGQGASLLFTVAPNKCSLYPEYLPRVGTPLPGEADIDRLRPLLEQEGVPYADLFAAFRAQPDVLYHRLDSHWNARGAALAHDVLTNGKAQPFFSGGWQAVRTHRGDLYEMLYPAGGALDETMVFDRAFAFTYVREPRSPEDQRIETQNPERTGSLLMFRDSFGNALYPFMADSYGKAVFSRAMPYSLTLLEETGADTLVIELVERNLKWLALRAPIFPAPQRGLTGEPPQGSVSARVKISDDGLLPGFLRIEGSLSGAVDEQSPVYVRLGGMLYEASPSGGGEFSFTLYVPEDAQTEETQVLYLMDGSLYIVPAAGD